MIAGLGALPLTACGGARREPETATQGSLRAPRLHPPRFGDSDPVDFGPRHPGRHAVHGIDLARFQSSVDWPVAQRAGVNFAFVKATEGGDLLDPNFKAHFRGARAAGVPVGAYHFYYFCTPPEVQARWFIRNVPKRAGMLPPVLDMEWNPFSPTCKLRPEAAEVRRQMRKWIAIVGAHYGQVPIVYTTPGFYADNDLSKVRSVEYWLRSTATHPREKFPGQHWHFWQYSGTGIVPGIAEPTDLNVFHGSSQAWAVWLEARRV